MLAVRSGTDSCGWARLVADLTFFLLNELPNEPLDEHEFWYWRFEVDAAWFPIVELLLLLLVEAGPM